MIEKFLLILMVNFQLSTLRESNQRVVGPVRYARDTEAMAPAFRALTVQERAQEKHTDR